MATTHYALITTAGTAAIAAARAAMMPLDISAVSMGDGGGAAITPAVGDVALTNQVWSGSALVVDIDQSDPSIVRILAAIPASEGGWTIREVGVWDSGGTLIAIGSTPATYQPTAAEGGIGPYCVQIELEITDAAEAVALVDSNVVIASKHYVRNQIAALLSVHGYHS